MDLRRKAIFKTFTWRAIATLITTGVAWVLTGRLEIAATIGVLDAALKLFAYYAHERAWDVAATRSEAALESE